MRRWCWLVLIALLGLYAAPSEAKRQPAGECPYPLRTAAPLPRQAQATLVTRLSPQPYPTAGTQPLDALQPGDAVKVVGECVMWVKVETAAGTVAWAPVTAIGSEQLLVEAAVTAFNVARKVPDPCQRYVPTGAPLPRESFTGRSAPLFIMPNRFGDPPFYELPEHTQVTVLRECGKTLRIRAADGVEGWVDLVMIDNENRLRQAALQKPVTSADE